ncbi:CDP-glycerol glycerophosphotransferase family protein [Paenibacillus sp. IITD108]|uniref:CDP-glycerol glycerophosphotransferase family protein n=1 Tax=Paenibacillus sp. IITD108 TaxID=3116649 RepID=UPI002F427789
MKDIVLFGASSLGQEAYAVMHRDYNIISFADNSELKWQTYFCDKPVWSIEQVVAYENAYIVITSMYTLEISKQLAQLGITEFGVYHGSYTDKDGKVNVRIEHIDLKSPVYNQRHKRIALTTTSYSGSNIVALQKFMPEKYKMKYSINFCHSGEMGYHFFSGYSFLREILENRMLVFDVVSPSSKAEDSFYFQLWHGFPIKGLGYTEKPAVENEKQHQHWLQFDDIASYSSFYNIVMGACMGIPRDKFVTTGMPRNDFLYRTNGREKLEKLLNVNFADQKIIYLMPTYRQSKWLKQTSGNRNWSNIFGFDSFREADFSEFLKENNIALVIKTHPLEEEEVMPYLNRLGDENIYLLPDQVLLDQRTDLYETLNAADLLITDYSSVYFDYLLLDRPILFTPVDLDEYSESRGFVLEPYEMWTPGPKIMSQSDLQVEITKLFYNESYYDLERRKLKEMVHVFMDGKSSERVWDRIDKRMDGEN